MGVSITCRKTGRTIDMGAGGFLRLRRKVSELQGGPFHDVYEEVCALTRDFFEGHPAFTLAEYRDLLGTSRKYALAILEFFDKTKVTKMVGDHREVIGSL